METRRRPVRKSAGGRLRRPGNPLGRPDVEQVSARFAGPRADVHEQVGRADDRQVVLDDDDRVARVPEAPDDRRSGGRRRCGCRPTEGSSST